MMTAAGGCPLPPPGITNRTLPVVTIDLHARPLYRVHRSSRGAVHFNQPSVTTQRYRFDAPAGSAPGREFGVLYGGFSLSCCVFETIVRDRFAGVPVPLLIEQTEFDTRSISRVVTDPARPLRLVDFTQPLAPFGASTLIMSVNDYEGPSLWSEAVHDNVNNLDGIYFTSRFSGEPCVAVFDRVSLAVAGAAVPLLTATGTDAFLTLHGIDLF
ncbi:MAG: RES family NAD+ phosphorylase [Pseudomonadota bacterium]